MRPDETDEVLGVLERISGALVVSHGSRRVAAQGQDVLDRRRGVAIQQSGDLILGVANAGQMRDGGQLGFTLNSHDQVVGSLPCRAPRAIGHRNERWLEGLQLSDRLEKLFRGLVGLGWEELETEGGRTRLKNILDVHGRRWSHIGPVAIRVRGFSEYHTRFLRGAGVVNTHRDRRPTGRSEPAVTLASRESGASGRGYAYFGAD